MAASLDNLAIGTVTAHFPKQLLLQRKGWLVDPLLIFIAVLVLEVQYY